MTVPRSTRSGKFNAKRMKADGYTFDSLAEHSRYCELRLLQAGRQISQLTVHPRYPLIVNGAKVGTYECDFSYLEPRAMPPQAIVYDGSITATGGITTVRVCEDVKGFVTPEARLKMNLFKALYPDADFRELNTDKASVRKAWTKFAGSRGAVQTQAGGK